MLSVLAWRIGDTADRNTGVNSRTTWATLVTYVDISWLSWTFAGLAWRLTSVSIVPIAFGKTRNGKKSLLVDDIVRKSSPIVSDGSKTVCIMRDNQRTLMDDRAVKFFPTLAIFVGRNTWFYRGHYEVSSCVQNTQLASTDLSHLWYRHDIRLSINDPFYTSVASSALLYDSETLMLILEDVGRSSSHS